MLNLSIAFYPAALTEASEFRGGRGRWSFLAATVLNVRTPCLFLGDMLD